MKSQYVTSLCAAALVLLITGCAPKGEMLTSPVPDNAAGCHSGNNVSSPPLLYQAMQSCVRQQDYPQAVNLFAQAGSYSWYDALRSGSEDARRQHHELLRQALEGLDKTQREELWQNLRETLGQPEPRAQICQRINALGAPAYHAAYMTASSDSDNTPDPALWQQAMNSYLHCAD